MPDDRQLQPVPGERRHQHCNAIGSRRNPDAVQKTLDAFPSELFAPKAQPVCVTMSAKLSSGAPNS
jgi:hypothetical protein